MVPPISAPGKITIPSWCYVPFPLFHTRDAASSSNMKPREPEIAKEYGLRLSSEQLGEELRAGHRLRRLVGVEHERIDVVDEQSRVTPASPSTVKPGRGRALRGSGTTKPHPSTSRRVFSDRPAVASASSDSSESAPARTYRPVNASSVPEASANARSVTCSGEVQSSPVRKSWTGIDFVIAVSTTPGAISKIRSPLSCPKRTTESASRNREAFDAEYT